MKGRLNRKKVEYIKAAIANWKGELTWLALIEAVRARVGRYSRQALWNRKEVYRAYVERRRELSAPAGGAGKSKEMQSLMRERDTALAENKELKRANAELGERFLRWSYNASLRGMFEDELDRPPPPINRR